MENYELFKKEAIAKIISLIDADLYSPDEKRYLLEILPDILNTLGNILQTKENLIFEELFHAVCLKKLSMIGY